MDSTKVAAAGRIVIKVGTSLLTDGSGRLDVGRMENLVRQIAALVESGRQLILVSSGAIGAGIGRVGLGKRPSSLTEKQALAAIGQCTLMHTYDRLFGGHGITVAQILLTRDDLESPVRRNNARATFEQLLAWQVLPIVNENDTVATEEIRVGDNDNLSALVAELVGADLLVILSDVGGLYPEDPRQRPGLEPIPLVREITPELWAAGGGPGSAYSTGGMSTKLEAARTCLGCGIAVIITDGNRPGVLTDIAAGRVHGTLFLSEEVQV
ncbi:MAG TPA: glutamate 5-kinase [Bacillota bacterium]